MFPIYIISKGRSRATMKTGTTGALSKFGIPHYIMVEPQEEELYNNNKFPASTILTIPQSERDKDHERFCDWSIGKEAELGASMGRGAVASRNSTKLHAKESGARAFYNMDDNATGFFKWMTEKELDFYDCWHALQQDETVPEKDRSYYRNLEKWGFAKVSMMRFNENEGDKVKQIFFDDFEPNLFKIDNLAFIGFNTVDACPRCVAQYLIRPVGRRVYSCTLMKSDYELEWWGQTSDDVLLNIDCLSHGYVMACLWRWVMGKPFTQTTKGGCTTDAYGHTVKDKIQTKDEMINTEKYALSTYPKTKFITSMYPQYLHTKAWKHRIHHEFLWDLMPNPEFKVDLTKDVPESKSQIDFLFPYMKEEYKKAVATKALITKAPPKPKKKLPGFHFGQDKDMDIEILKQDEDDYLEYDESVDLV
jgi:hypothetical protein